MSIVAKLDEILKRVIGLGYWKLPIPSDVDNDIINCIQNYQMLSNEVKASFKSDITNDIARLLLYFSERMATLSLRTSSQNMFQFGLLALDMINIREDTREILLIMPLFYDASKRNKLSFEEILNQKNDFSVFVKDFLERDEESKSLKCMGYIFTKDENNNPIYQRT